MSSQSYGLYDLSGRKLSIPLVGVRCNALLVNSIVEVELVQLYKNKESDPIEAIYVFPVDEGAAVSGFEARIGSRTVKGIVKEKEEAREQYDDALASGHGAYLMESSSADTLSVKLGNILAGEEVELTVRYSALCDVEGDAVTFKVPTTIKERYTPEVPNPKKDPGTKPTYQSTVGYGLTFHMDIFMKGNILSVSSSTHPLKVKNDPSDPHHSTVELGVVESSMDHDLIVSVEHTAVHEPAICLASEPDVDQGSAAVMLSFMPQFDGDEPSENSELMFLVDRSGSMGYGGQSKSPMEQCKEALQLFLKSLPEGCFFNIVSFGSSYEKLFPESKCYDGNTMKTASDHVSRMSSNLGGTEILQPLVNLLEAKPAVKGAPRQIFLLTDGSVHNTNDIVREVRRHAESTRVFTFGVGDSAGQELVRGVARAGRGEACFVRDGEAIDEKVITQLEKALQPTFEELALDWGCMRVVHQSPSADSLPPVFNGSHYTVFALLESGSQQQGEVTLSGKLNGEAHSYKLQVSPWTVERTSTRILHSMASQRIIRDLEESVEGGDKHAKVITTLSVKWQVMSSLTSFVAIEEREEAVGGVMKTVHVPLASVCKGGPSNSLPASASGAFPQILYAMPCLGMPASPPMGACFAATAPQAQMAGMSFGVMPPPPTGMGAPLMSFGGKTALDSQEWGMAGCGGAPPPMSLSAGLHSSPRGGSMSVMSPSAPMGRMSAEGMSHPPVDMGVPVMKTAASTSDCVQAVSRLQQSDGSWLLNAELASAVELPLQRLQQEKPSTQSADVWGTAVAIAYLVVKCSDRKAAFKLLARKAERWMAKQPGSSKELVDQLIEKAKSLF